MIIWNLEEVREEKAKLCDPTVELNPLEHNILSSVNAVIICGLQATPGG
jgi:hypothetical protein